MSDIRERRMASVRRHVAACCAAAGVPCPPFTDGQVTQALVEAEGDFDPSKHPRGKGGQFQKGGGAGGGGKSEQGDGAAGDKKVHERQKEIADHLDNESEKVLYDVRQGIRAPSVLRDIRDLEKHMTAQTEVNYRNRLRGLRARMKEKYGHAALDSQEWTEVEGTFDVHETQALGLVKAQADGLRDFLTQREEGQEMTRDAVDGFLIDQQKQRAALEAEWKADITKALTDFAAAHRPVHEEGKGSPP